MNIQEALVIIATGRKIGDEVNAQLWSDAQQVILRERERIDIEAEAAALQRRRKLLDAITMPPCRKVSP